MKSAGDGERNRAGTIAFTQEFGNRIQIIGDDYITTSEKMLRKAAAEGACNAVLVKVNQAGTVSEMLDTFMAAEELGYRNVISARSGETEDVSITHMSAGLGGGQLKVGSFTRSERMVKWNECLRLQNAPGMGGFAAGESLGNTWWGRKRP